MFVEYYKEPKYTNKIEYSWYILGFVEACEGSEEASPLPLPRRGVERV